MPHRIESRLSEPADIARHPCAERLLLKATFPLCADLHILYDGIQEIRIL